MKTRRTGSPENKCSSCDVLDLPTLLHGTKMHSFKANLNLLNIFEILSARWPGPQVAKNNDKDWWSVQQKSETFLDMVNWLHPQVSERLCCSVGSSSDRVAPDLTHQPLLPKRFNPRSFTKTPRPWLPQATCAGCQGANTSNCSSQQSSQKASEEDATW